MNNRMNTCNLISRAWIFQAYQAFITGENILYFWGGLWIISFYIFLMSKNTWWCYLFSKESFYFLLSPDLFNVRFSFTVCTCTLHVIVLTDMRSARCNCHKFFPRNVNIWVCTHFPFTQTDHNIAVCASRLKPLSNKAVDWFCRVSLKMFYISWPLIIIWLYKFQFPALKGHTGWLEALVFTWLWNSRYLYSTIDRTWQMYASCQLVILPVWDGSLVTFAVFGGDCTYGFTLPTGWFRRQREILALVGHSYDFLWCPVGWFYKNV